MRALTHSVWLRRGVTVALAVVLLVLLPVAAWGDTVYVVQPGDSLSAIAAQYKTTVAAIAQANGISNVNLIYAGQRLTIPTSAGGPATTAPASPSVSTAGKLDGTSRIAVMSAFTPEMQLLLGQCAGSRAYVVNGRTFTTCSLNGAPVVMFLSGVSMVNAAMTSQLALDKFNITRIVFSGIAGGVNPNLQVGDVTVPAQWSQYQENRFARDQHNGNYQLPPDYKKEFGNFGMMHPQRVQVTRAGLEKPDAAESIAWFQVDPAMLDVARQVAGQVQLSRCTPTNVCLGHDPKVTVGGNGVSGPTFVDNAEYREYAWNNWQADALDMESAAVAHVAYANGVPFIVFRSLSDLAGGGPGENEIGTFFRLASDNSAKVLLAFLEAWQARS